MTSNTILTILQSHDLFGSRDGMSEYHLHSEYGNEVVRQEMPQQNHPEIEGRSSDLTDENISGYNLDLSCENEVGGYDTRKEVESRESIVTSFLAGMCSEFVCG